MADTIIKFYDDSGDLVPVKAVDNGDGTYKIQVDAAVSISGLSVGEVDQGAGGASAWLVSGPLTDTELRAADVKVSLDSEVVTISGTIIATETLVTVDNNFTGIITVTSSGTPVSGDNVTSTDGFFLKGHPDNTDTVWFMPDGRTKANGFPLNANNITLARVLNLNLLDFDSDVNGGKICWQKA